MSEFQNRELKKRTGRIRLSPNKKSLIRTASALRIELYESVLRTGFIPEVNGNDSENLQENGYSAAERNFGRKNTTIKKRIFASKLSKSIKN